MQGFEGLKWPAIAQRLRKLSWGLLVTLVLTLSLASPAIASLTDDHYDGNIFPLYGGNGYLVPPRVTLTQSLERNMPAVMVFYIDDSSDCKQYTPVMSSVDAFYGRNVNIIPIIVDSLPVKDHYTQDEPGYYYKGLIPQTVVFDQSGKVVLDEAGVIPYESIDDVLREVFDLVPRSESIQLKRRAVNELNTELVQ